MVESTLIPQAADLATDLSGSNTARLIIDTHLKSLISNDKLLEENNRPWIY